MQRIINNMNCQFVSYSPDISGFDGEVQLTDPSGELTTQLLKCQVKSGPSYITDQTDSFLSIRVRTAYVEMWRGVNQPVVLFYYDVTSDTVYWLSVKEYLKEHGVTSSSRKTSVFVFDKARDVFTEDCYGRLLASGEGRVEYDKPPELKPEGTERLYANWFAIKEFPAHVYVSPTSARVKSDIPSEVTDRHALILKEENLFCFVDPRSSEQLVSLVERGEAERRSFSVVSRAYVAELLNAAVHVDAISRGLLRLRAAELKYGFPLEVIRKMTNEFTYQTLSGRRTQRKLVYVYRRHGERHTEYRRHALSIALVETPTGWFLELDPYMDYAYRPRKSRRETGAAITSGIQATYNYQYLLMLRLWHQFLSGGTGEIRVRTDATADSPAIVVDAEMPPIEAQFSMTKDPLEGGLM